MESPLVEQHVNTIQWNCINNHHIHYWPARAPRFAFKGKNVTAVGFNVTAESELPLTAICASYTYGYMTTIATIIASKNGYTICTRYGGILTARSSKTRTSGVFSTRTRVVVFCWFFVTTVAVECCGKFVTFGLLAERVTGFIRYGRNLWVYAWLCINLRFMVRNFR